MQKPKHKPIKSCESVMDMLCSRASVVLLLAKGHLKIGNKEEARKARAIGHIEQCRFSSQILTEANESLVSHADHVELFSLQMQLAFAEGGEEHVRSQINELKLTGVYRFAAEARAAQLLFESKGHRPSYIRAFVGFTVIYSVSSDWLIKSNRRDIPAMKPGSCLLNA